MSATTFCYSTDADTTDPTDTTNTTPPHLTVDMNFLAEKKETSHASTAVRDSDEYKAQCSSQVATALENEYIEHLEGLKMPHESIDHLCRRYLVTHDWDTGTAISHVEQTIMWRKEEGILVLAEQTPDSILGCSEVDVLSCMPMWWTDGDIFEQRDQAGRPVFCYHIGALDVKGLMKLTDISSFLRYIVWRMEQVMSVVGGSHDRGVDKFVMVFDLKGLGMLSHLNRTALAVVRTMSKVGATYYPETLHKMFLINAPRFFIGAWSTIRPMINSQTKAKIIITGNGNATNDALLANMSRDVVDSVLGSGYMG